MNALDGIRLQAAIETSRLLAHAAEVTPELMRRAEEDAVGIALLEELIGMPDTGPLSKDQLRHAQDWLRAQAEWAIENNEPGLPTRDRVTRYLGILAAFRPRRRRRSTR